ncbi:(2Fe-2S)-binding protein [Christiangramia crocea]|uniref:(2Fe-2S)-binding protein n=1 Tax=Christiangramia crocea TaxID=2904124 RepID=A0A9X2A4I2_9FLAO|nr:(2Fe-2S)-binding protein [Gramella crocea]MCG9970470.1 (2Fe-2S)-binding protein [Gramella crocea]
MDKISLTVNSKKYQLETDPETPLLYVLRNQLELNGPKYGCGYEQCGACMVLLDDKAYPSCRIPVSVVQNRDIITLKGLGNRDKLHPVQEAFLEEQAAQCGYCLNGMLISTISLLKENPDPDRAAIDEGLKRVLCRCGTHSRFIKAVEKAAAKSRLR